MKIQNKTSDDDSAALISSYDLLATEYTNRIYDELRHKPFDRDLLKKFASRIEAGRICDIGTGPGQVARFLKECGADVLGLDLSKQMVEEAKRLNPGIEFLHGDMSNIDVENEAWEGIVAFYSIIHIARESIPKTLAEFRRVLKPDGLVLVAFHIGDTTLHLEELWGYQVSMDFHEFEPKEMESFFKSSGFVVEEIYEREPYPEVEHQSRRCYILARKPA